MKKKLRIASAITAAFFMILSSCEKKSGLEKSEKYKTEPEIQPFFKPNQTVLNAMEGNEFLNKIYLQTGFYYCAETNQLMLIKIDSTDKIIINENFQEKLNLYTICYALNADGNLRKKESSSTPVESIKNIKSVYENLQKNFEFSENGSMTYIDVHGKKFEKYDADIRDENSLASEITNLFHKKFDLYLGSYRSDEYNKVYTLSKNENIYTLEVKDENNDIVKDFFEFSPKASLPGKESRYFIRIDKELDSFHITEYVDYSLYPDYDEMTNGDEYKDIIKQESVSFKLADKK